MGGRVDRHLGGLGHRGHGSPYRRRHLVEALLARCEQYRALATRYDKRGDAFRAAWVIVTATRWLPGQDLHTDPSGLSRWVWRVR